MPNIGGRTKIYDLLLINNLMEGPDPIAAETVEKLGRVKAVELARLSLEQRTPDVIEAALGKSIPEVKRLVQNKINATLPPQEQKEPTMLFSRTLPVAVVEMIEEVEEDGVCLEGVRDGDRSVTLLGKLWYAVWTSFRAFHQEELKEARKYGLAVPAKNADLHTDVDQSCRRRSY